MLVAEVWRRNLDYAKNYFTSENIPIYGICELSAGCMNLYCVIFLITPYITVHETLKCIKGPNFSCAYMH